jgi:glycosyltransferase involved in cell wall biosynthesis
LPGGDRVEVLIIDDGSTDDTGKIADEYALRYPGIVRAIHKENGGHGDAVMTGLKHATGLYFKVVDSDDWVDAEAYPKVLSALEGLSAPDKQVDLLVSNYIYDKVGATAKKVVRYGNALPENRVLTWRDISPFRMGQYILMHAAMYRTELLRACDLRLPQHTFYVDNLYAYAPIKNVERLYYVNANLYHYYIGREGQSVQEQVMIRRIDQQLKVNLMMAKEVDLNSVFDRQKRRYLRNYLEIVTAVSTVLLIKSGSEENLQKKRALWQTLKEKHPAIYRMLRWRPMGLIGHLPGQAGRRIAVLCYEVCQRIYGFN